MNLGDFHDDRSEDEGPGVVLFRFAHLDMPLVEVERMGHSRCEPRFGLAMSRFQYGDLLLKVCGLAISSATSLNLDFAPSLSISFALRCRFALESLGQLDFAHRE